MGLATRLKGAWHALRADGFTPPPPDSDWWYTTANLGASHDALRMSAVHACASLIAQTVACFPRHIYERTPDGGKRLASDHPAYRCLHSQANEETTAFEFWESAILHMCLTGNAYALLTMDAKMNVSEMRLLSPADVTVEREPETGRKFYRVSKGAPKTIYLDMEGEILHLPALGYDGLRGFSPVEYAGPTISTSLQAESYAKQFFDNYAMPHTWMQYPGTLSVQQKEMVYEQLKKRQGVAAGKAHAPFVVDGGASIHSINVDHQAMQFEQIRRFLVEEVARRYRVPLHMIQSMVAATHNNIEHEGLAVKQYTFQPWVSRIESRLNMSLFGPRERDRYFAEFNMDGLLRADSAARAAFYAAMRSGGLLSSNEVRAKENMSPISAEQGGDEYFIQGAMMPMSKAMQGVQP